METTKVLEYIPAVLVLASVMILAVLALTKYGDQIFEKEFNASTTLLFVTAFLFVTILIVNLFHEQTWTADTLKILIGVLVGAGSTKLAAGKSGDGSSVGVSDNASITGSNIAGRDQYIQSIEKAINEIKDSIVHQNSQIKQYTPKEPGATEDFIFHFLYRAQSLRKDMEAVVTKWTTDGYRLKDIVSDFQGLDGMILVFARPSESGESTILYYRDSSFGQFGRD